MATKDISDLQVCQAVAEFQRRREALKGTNRSAGHTHDVLMAMTGESEEACEEALDRAWDAGLIECGSGVHAAWLAPEGEALLAENR